MDPLTIGLTALIWWGVEWMLTPAPEPFRKTCIEIHEPSETMNGNEIQEPVYCDEVQLKNGEYLK